MTFIALALRFFPREAHRIWNKSHVKPFVQCAQAEHT